MALGIIAFSESPISSLGKQDAVIAVSGFGLTSTSGTVFIVPHVAGQDLTSTVASVVRPYFCGDESTLNFPFRLPITCSGGLSIYFNESFQNCFHNYTDLNRGIKTTTG